MIWKKGRVNKVSNQTIQIHTRGSIIGISVCPNCHVINKIRDVQDIQGDKCKCQSCGSEITIEKRIKSR